MSPSYDEVWELPHFEVTVDGTKWDAQMATCETFRLTMEDHGCFTAVLNFEGQGWGQGVSAHALDEYDPAHKTRVGTAFGLEYVKECVRVLGSPEEAKGTRVVVLRAKDDGMIEGFARLNDDGTMGRPFFPKELSKAHYPPKLAEPAPTPEPAP